MDSFIEMVYQFCKEMEKKLNECGDEVCHNKIFEETYGFINNVRLVNNILEIFCIFV